MLYSNDDIITSRPRPLNEVSVSMCRVITAVYDDPTPGAKAPVTLLPGYSSSYSDYGVTGGCDEGEGTVVLGTISIAPEISWITMDTKICDIFMVT